MQLFFFFFRSSKKIVLLAAIAVVITGVANVLLLPLIRPAIRETVRPSEDAASTALLMLQFFGLCLLLVACQITSQAMLIKLSRTAVAKLSMHLCQRILSVPLRKLEEI